MHCAQKTGIIEACFETTDAFKDSVDMDASPTDTAETPALTGEPAAPEGYRSLDERIAVGKAQAQDLPLEQIGDPPSRDGRPDIIEVLRAEAKDRLADLLPLRHARMAVNPFATLRGTAAIMAADLASRSSTNLIVQLCGDAHLSNFGMYGSPERSLVFDVNDFDETLEAPFEWDVKRLAASVYVAAIDNGFTPAQATAATTNSAAAYRSVMAELATMTFLEIHYARVNVAELEQFLPTDKARRSFAKSLANARSKDNLQALEKLTTVTQNGQVQIADQPPLVDHPPDSRDMAKVIPLVISQYRATLLSDRLEVFNRYHLVDTARKVVGVGSVGLDARIALFLGRDDQDPLFLQMKEARASVLAPYAGPSPYRHHGQRVVEGQRLMQAASDMFLGWYSGVMGTRRQYYVRQLRDMKGSADVARMTPDGLAAYAALCGGTLARSHARSGDPAMITGYLGTGPQFDEAIADFAKDYAVQTVADHSLLQEAITSGRITAIEGI